MGRTGRIAVLVAVAAVAFGGGLVLLGDEPPAEPTSSPTQATTAESPPDTAALVREARERGCAARTVADPSYDVRTEMEPDPPRAEGTTFRLTVTRDGRPVTGATVCLQADMTDMSHEGVAEQAREIAPGVYEAADVSFPMRGGWSGNVKVIAPDSPAVRSTLGFTVE